DGAPSAGAAHRADAHSRRAELELARIRHAGRRGALLRSVQGLENSADAGDQRPGLRGLRARRQRSEERRLGIHGPLLSARPDPRRTRSEENDYALARRARALLRQAAGRLARAGAYANARVTGFADASR